MHGVISACQIENQLAQLGLYAIFAARFALGRYFAGLAEGCGSGHRPFSFAFVEFVLVVAQVFWFMDSFSDRYGPEPWRRAFVASLIHIVLYGTYEVFFIPRPMGRCLGNSYCQ